MARTRKKKSIKKRKKAGRPEIKLKHPLVFKDTTRTIRKTKVKTNKKSRTKSRQINKYKLVERKVIQTLNFGTETLNINKAPHTIGGAIQDDINFMNSEAAFDFFLKNSKATLFNASSLSGRIMHLRLKDGFTSPYTSYDRNTFLKLETGNIKDLIVKFMIVSESAYRDFITTLPESKQQLNIVTKSSILKEYIIQNKIACITANDDKYNKYLMGTPYNIYSNIRNLTEDNTKKYIELLKNLNNVPGKDYYNDWKEFYEIPIQEPDEYKICMIAMTMVKGEIGDKLLDKPVYNLWDYTLDKSFGNMNLSNSPVKKYFDNPTITRETADLLLRDDRSFIEKMIRTKQKPDLTTLKGLFHIYSPYIAIIYSVLRITALTGFLHLDLHRDNYFIVKENTDFFELSRVVIIDWGQVYELVQRHKEKYKKLWEEENFTKLLKNIIEQLESFNKRQRNNTFHTITTFYNIIGQENTIILLTLYHNESKKRSDYYDKKIEALWSKDKLPMELSIARLEETLDKKGKEYGSMHLNLLMKHGYVARREKSSQE